MKTKFHKSLALVVSILLGWMVPAESWSAVEWDGIYYELNTSAKTATVTSNPDKYSGHVFLPESISYHDGITYTVTRIGTCAFLDCSSLTGITIPSGVTVIEPSAFERCSGLTALTVGKGVTTIDYEAFKNCISLATLILPASLKTIGNESFGGCSSLRTIVEERTTAPKIASTTFSSVDKSACTLYVPEGCRSAYANAAYWKLFTNIVDNRTDVLASGKCGDNVTYTIYSDMKMVISGEGEMWDNDGFENPICGDYSKSIQQLIIEEGVTTISDYAFFGYNRLTSVDIPPSITVLGNSAFRGCSSLERINIHDLTAWCGIEFGNTNMDYYPDAPFDNMPLYLNGKLLEELVLTDEITDISAGAFYNCRSLTSVHIFTDLPGIRPYTFDGCENVTFLYIGYSLGYFGWFSINMPNLRTFVLDVSEPPTLLYHMSIRIGNATIYVPSISLAAYQNDSGTYGDESWKAYSRKLKGFMFSTNFIFYGLEPENLTAKVIDTEYMNSTVPFDVTIPETIACDGATYTVTGIGHKAFELFNEMSEIILPSTITSVEDLAFNKLRGMTDVYCRAVEPPAASASSFQNMNVGSVVLHVPAASKEAYQRAEGWKDFASIVDEIVVLETGSCGENTEYTIYSDGTMKIAGTGTIEEFIPETVSSNFIQELTIEEGVTHIGKYAFSGVKLSYGWYTINEWQSLATVHVPGSVTSIGQLAFVETPWYNSQPDGVVYAGKVVCGVKGMDGQDVILQEGTLGISPSAFWGVHIASLHIPASVASIDPSISSYEDAFVESLSYDSIDFIAVDPENPHFDSRDNCNAIIETAANRLIVGSRNMTIPEGVTTIAPFALSGQTTVTIPASVTSIEEFAFTNSYEYWIPGPLVGYIYGSEPSPVETIEMKGSNPPEIKSPGKVGYENSAGAYVSDNFSTFGGVDQQVCTLVVPKGSKEAYQSAEGWKDFLNIEEYEDITDISALDNAIYVEQIEGCVGGTMDIPVKLKNNFAVRGFQFTLELPEGATINSWALSTDRLPEGATLSNQMSTEKIDGNKIQIACSLNYGDATFTGNEGEIATVNVTFGPDMEVGTYPIYLTDCDVSTADGTDMGLSDIKATLVLEDYLPGDANGDGKVRIGDATAILNYIVGSAPDNFQEKAADVNGDGKIRIGDVAAVLNIIVNQ